MCDVFLREVFISFENNKRISFMRIDMLLGLCKILGSHSGADKN
jgi:hypothetical protein